MDPKRFLKIAYSDPDVEGVKTIVADMKRVGHALSVGNDAASTGKMDRLTFSEMVGKALRVRNKVQKHIEKMKATGADNRQFKSYDMLKNAILELDRGIDIAMRTIRAMTKSILPTPPEYDDIMVKGAQSQFASELPKLEEFLYKLNQSKKRMGAFPKRVHYNQLKALYEKLIARLKTLVEAMNRQEVPDKDPELSDAYTNVLHTARVEYSNLCKLIPRKFS